MNETPTDGSIIKPTTDQSIAMLYEYALATKREDCYNITSQVREAVTKSGVSMRCAFQPP